MSNDRQSHLVLAHTLPMDARHAAHAKNHHQPFQFVRMRAPGVRCHGITRGKTAVVLQKAFAHDSEQRRAQTALLRCT